MARSTISTSPAQVRTQMYHRLNGLRRAVQQAQAEAGYLGLHGMEDDLSDLALWLDGASRQVGLCKRPPRLPGAPGQWRVQLSIPGLEAGHLANDSRS